jgi:hypothetical protein
MFPENVLWFPARAADRDDEDEPRSRANRPPRPLGFLDSSSGVITRLTEVFQFEDDHHRASDGDFEQGVIKSVGKIKGGVHVVFVKKKTLAGIRSAATPTRSKPWIPTPERCARWTALPGSPRRGTSGEHPVACDWLVEADQADQDDPLTAGCPARRLAAHGYLFVLNSGRGARRSQRSGAFRRTSICASSADDLRVGEAQ